MNKSELIETLASKTGVTKTDAAKIVAAFTETVTETLASGDSVQLIGFGTFKPVAKAAKTCRNPKTGETVKVPAKTVAKFQVGGTLANAVNTPKKSKKK